MHIALSRPRRLVGVAAALGLALGAVVVTAAPAAATASATLTPTSVSYVDSAAPATSFTPGSNNYLPAGAYVGADGTVHTTRTYLTFSLASLTKDAVVSADLLDLEGQLNDCATGRDTEVWLTAAAARPTWNKRPAEQLDSGGPAPQPTCPSTGVPIDWSVTTAISAAQQAGRGTVTLELRSPGSEETDPAHMRYFAQAPSLVLSYSAPPSAPDQLQVNGQDCANTPIGVPDTRSNYLIITPRSSTDSQQDVTVDYWPVDHPDQVTDRVFTGWYANDPSYDYLTNSALTDGTTYAWHARGTVNGLTGPWSRTCTFNADYTAPPNPPTISSTDYPSPGAAGGNGGSGIPGTFTFKPNGDTDTTTYWYGWGGDPDGWHVAAARKGGPASVSIVAPGSGPETLTVVAQDSAGNVSPPANYTFTVKDNRPVVHCDPATYAEVAVRCTFAPGAATSSAVVGYDYRFDEYGQATDVPASANTTITVPVTPQNAGTQTLDVSALLDNGNSTEDTLLTMTAAENAPTVTGPAGPVGFGTAVTFTMHAVLPGSTTFRYQWNGAAVQELPVGPDGDTTITETTGDQPGPNTLLARSVTADGTVSDPGGGSVPAVSDVPVVTSTDYPENNINGQIGTPGTFTLSSALPGVTSYRYSLDGADPVTVPAGAGGTATVTLTPESYENDLVVSAAYGDGHTSATYDYSFEAATYAPYGVCDEAGAAGQDTTCYLFPQQYDAVSLTYTLDGSAPVTVPVDPDFNLATITLTEPDHPEVLSMTTTDSAGHVSDPGTIDLTGVPTDPSTVRSGPRAH